MQLKNLTLTHIRAFNHAEFTFHPGMNLIVGINGVGKSTVLDVLCILFSQILPQLTQSRSKPFTFVDSDITISQNALTAELNFEIDNTDFRYLVHQPHTTISEATGEARSTSLFVTYHDGKIMEGFKFFKNNHQQSLVLYFSPRRALANSNKSVSRAKGLAAAFTDALDHRELRLVEFADWWIAQTTLATENALHAQRHLDVLNTAITSMIDTCTNVHAHRETYTNRDKNGKQTEKSQTTLLIDKAGTTLDLNQLSDGERGILALVLDLARRLSITNPQLEDPLKGQAVVLIDELDLHLHPQWQRTIVQKLTTTFPNCQFIATTHSPLIVGEVPPENIILLEDGQLPFRPDQSLGMDTDWILKYLMGATTRNHETENTLKYIANLIETEDYDKALDAIDALRDQIGEFPELVRLQTRIDRFQLLGE